MKKNEIKLKEGFTTTSTKGWYDLGDKGFVCSNVFDYRWVNMHEVKLEAPSIRFGGKLLGDE